MSSSITDKRSAERVARIQQVMAEAGVDLAEMLNRCGYVEHDVPFVRAMSAMRGNDAVSMSFMANVAQAFGVSFDWIAFGRDVLYGESPEPVYLDSVPA